jgi:acyl-CoA synthetase (AMP-forming)/AMP-acid ligase II
MPETAWGSCGKPFAGMQVRIADPDSGAEVPAGTVGMIHIRGPHVMRGICRRAREEVFTPDGFYPTGDLGHLDADGFLFYHGRTDDMFKVSGSTVYPTEIEQALRTLDGVTAAFVTNVAGAQGNRVGAAVVCESGRSADEFREAARRVLSSFKVPTVWAVLGSDDDVPRGATGKVDVARLRDLLGSAALGSASRTLGRVHRQIGIAQDLAGGPPLESVHLDDTDACADAHLGTGDTGGQRQSGV